MKRIQFNLAQTNALNAIRQARKKGIHQGVIILPTGTGKTYLVAIDAKHTSKKILYLAHQETILFQAKKSFEQLTKLKTSFYISRKEKKISQATFATIQTMRSNYRKLSRKQFDYIIVDECHHAQANSYKKVIKYFQPKNLIGLTATPYRKDNQNIFAICGQPYYTMTLREAIEAKLLAQIEYYYVDNDIDFSKIHSTFGHYDENDLNKKLLIPKYDQAILKEYQKSAKRKRTIIFCATIAHTQRLKKVFENNNIPVAIAHSKMKRKEISQNINDFFDHKVNVILVRDLFNEGIDVPSCDCIMLLRPTESKTIFQQQIGRGLRLTKKKRHVLILDFTANSLHNRFNLDVLNELTGGKLFQNIYAKVNGVGSYNAKEIIVYESNFRIRLNKQKIDILRNFDKNIEARKKRMKEYYLLLKEKLGHEISANEMRANNTQYGFGYDAYCLVFGSWRKFKEEMGFEFFKSKELILSQLKLFKKKHGHFPTTREIRKNGLISDNTIVSRFGSYEVALQLAGGAKEVRKHMLITKQGLVEDFYRLKKEMGKTPYLHEFNESVNYNASTAMTKFFGRHSYRVFLKSIGESFPVKPKWHYLPKSQRTIEMK